MDKELLREIGTILYGLNFRSAMARDLGVADRTVRRWLAGEYAVPIDAMEELAISLYAKKVTIGRVRLEIARAIHRHPQH